MRMTLARGVVGREKRRGDRYLSFVFANVVARNKGQGSGTSSRSWPFGQQGRGREQISYASGCRLSTPGDWTSKKLGLSRSCCLTAHNNDFRWLRRSCLLCRSWVKGGNAPQSTKCDKPLSSEVAPSLRTARLKRKRDELCSTTV